MIVISARTKELYWHFLKKHFNLNEKITLAGHNINFDVNFLRFFLKENNENFNKLFSHRFVDTSSILYYLYLSKNLNFRALSSDEAFNLFGIKVEGRHSALGDAIATAKLFTSLVVLTTKKLKNTLIPDNQLNLFESQINTKNKN